MCAQPRNTTTIYMTIWVSCFNQATYSWLKNIKLKLKKKKKNKESINSKYS